LSVIKKKTIFEHQTYIIMDLKTIKELLLKMYFADFSIENHIDIQDTKEQSFEFTTGFEFKDKNQKWHDVYMDVIGTAFIKEGYDDFHSPLGHGVSENQGDPNSIEEYHINEIEVYYDGDSSKVSISIDELINYNIKKAS